MHDGALHVWLAGKFGGRPDVSVRDRMRMGTRASGGQILSCVLMTKPWLAFVGTNRLASCSSTSNENVSYARVTTQQQQQHQQPLFTMMGYDHDNPIISSEHYNKDDDYTPDFLPPLTPSNHSSIAPPFDNTTTTSFSSSDDYISPAWAWLALLLLCVCLKPRTRDASYYIRQERIRQAAERPPPFVEAHNPEQRKQAIDQCLITKVRYI